MNQEVRFASLCSLSYTNRGSPSSAERSRFSCHLDVHLVMTVARSFGRGDGLPGSPDMGGRPRTYTAAYSPR